MYSHLGGQPYKAAAVQELLPAYLHFLARLGLIHRTDLGAALAKLKSLNKPMLKMFAAHDVDPRATDAVVAAWSRETLDVLRNDPALAERDAENSPQSSERDEEDEA